MSLRQPFPNVCSSLKLQPVHCRVLIRSRGQEPQSHLLCHIGHHPGEPARASMRRYLPHKCHRPDVVKERLFVFCKLVVGVSEDFFHFDC